MDQTSVAAIGRRAERPRLQSAFAAEDSGRCNAGPVVATSLPEAQATPATGRRRQRAAETAAHARLKRLALIWAQANGYFACAVEVSVPRCRFRADVAAFRANREGDRTAVFECKQALPDLRRDNCDSMAAREQLETARRRCRVIERNLRVHYPTLRTGESLFPDYDPFDFTRLHHRGHARALRDTAALEHRLRDCIKFEKLARYHCANLYYLVIARALADVKFELPRGWGVLVENGDGLDLLRKAQWHETTPETNLRFLRRVAAGATRVLNRELGIRRDQIEIARQTV